MLFFATSINYVDRQVLGLLAPTLQNSIGWTEAQYGYIVGAFQFAYAIGLVAAGRMVDRLGCRIGFAIIMGFWSLASMGHALASSALGFGIARFFLGLGEAGSFPAAIKATAEWFPQRERSLATGIFNSGANVGAIFAPALVPWITLLFGWRSAFLATGILGAIWIAWWLAQYRGPTHHPRVSPAELQHIQEDPAEPMEQLPWKKLLAYKQTWAYAAAKFLTDPIWYFYLYWLPKFFDDRYHLGLSHIGLPLIVVYNVSAVGSIGGGWLPSAFNKAGMPLAKSSTIRHVRLRVSYPANLLCEPGFFSVGRGWHLEPRDRGASGMVRESVYNRIGYVPAKRGGQRGRDRRNGGLDRFCLVFPQYRLGPAAHAQLHSSLRNCSFRISRWAAVPAHNCPGPAANRCRGEPRSQLTSVVHVDIVFSCGE